jgi:hypothetical protein
VSSRIASLALFPTSSFPWRLSLSDAMVGAHCYLSVGNEVEALLTADILASGRSRSSVLKARFGGPRAA